MPTSAPIFGGAGAFTGIFQVGEMLDDLVGRLARAEVQAKQTAAAAQAAAAVAAARTPAGGWTPGTGAQEGMSIARGMAVLGGSLSGVRMTNYIPDAEALLQQKKNQEVIEQLQTLADKLNSITKDSFLASIFTSEISGLRTGYLKPQEASDTIRTLMERFMPALLKEAIDPSLDANTRKIVAELQQFMVSGHIVIDGSQFANMQRFDAERKRQDEIRDILAKDRYNMTRAQMDELDKRLKELQGGQAATGQHVEAIREYTGQTNSTLSKTGRIAENLGAVHEAIREYAGQTNSTLSKTANTVEGISKNTEFIKADTSATRVQIREASEQAKKDAEEARKHLQQIGDELLHGVQVPVQLTDDLERWIIAHGG